TPGQESKRPFHIPLAMALLAESGKVLEEKVLELRKEKEVFEFPAEARPVPSFLRGFSAPVKLQYDYSRKELLLLLERDTDPFARWEAGQTLSLRILQDLIGQHAAGKDLKHDEDFYEALGRIASDASIDSAFRAQLLELPEE